MEKKIRVAIVGLGFGAEFIPIYQQHPHAELVAICQRNETKLNQIGDAFGIQKRYTSFEALLQDPEIDAVHINTPIPDHGPQSIQALKAGKHVACTVPMATTVEECRQIVELVQAWDPKLADAIVAENFFLDRSREEWMKRSRATLDQAGPITSVGSVTPENQLRGTFTLNGEKGRVRVFFTLTPEKTPRVQELRLTFVPPP